MRNKSTVLLTLLFIGLIAFSSIIIRNTWVSSMKETDTRATYIATASEILINGEAFKKLRAVPEDIGTTEYESLKKRMIELISIDKSIRFAYIYTQRDGKIYFMVDSEPAISEDCSPAGQEYTEAADDYKKPFENGRTLITKPVTDRWGTWVSVLVPMKDSITGKTIAVFAMDYPASTWTNLAVYRTVQVSIIIFLFMMLIAFFILFNKNITLKKERKKLEIANFEIEKARNSAEEATKAKSEFLANMSHEIRTPMNAIIGFSGLVMTTVMTPRQLDYVKKIDSSAKSLLEIINDILDFSKIEAGKLEIEEVDFCLDDVINNISSMISVKAAEKNIELLNNITSDVPYELVGDPLRLGQILANLATNAVKFTEKGHILINSELIEKNAMSCKIKFSVKDTGIGMTKAQIGKLFSAYSQADSSVTRKFGGTGLGLTISKHLVEMMNGELFIESEFGFGSTFAFVLEFKRQTDKKVNRVIDMETVRNLKVLIVDDNEMARRILKEQLSSFGIEAFTVDSGNAAITELKREQIEKPYDLVLMDYRMPGIDGIETAKIIFNDKNIVDMPMTIMITAFGREEVIEKAKKIGINAFLMKPVNQSLLFDTIMNILGMDDSSFITPLHEREIVGQLISVVNGAKVLLVEDNVLNQEVATEILTRAGIIVKIANNGKEAVDALKSSHFDAVLMDLQMPIMGGYEATHIIRTDEKNKELPIIAMTAHALKGAREECLAEGMDDYISKPIDPSQLLSVLKKWIKPRAMSLQTNSVNEIEEDSKSDIILPKSMPGIDIASGLKRINGNRKLYRKLLIDFSGIYSSASDDIRNAIEQGKADDALLLAHSIKGIAGNISAYDIESVSGELEAAISNKTEEKYDNLLIELDKALKSFDELIKPIIETEKVESSNSEEPLNIEKVEPILKNLALLVWEDNVEAANSLEELKKCIGDTSFAEEMQALAENIDNYDFEAAKEPLQKIAEKLNVILWGK